MKHKFILIISVLLLLNCKLAISQHFTDKMKTDSVFKFYFEILETELTGLPSPKDKQEYYDYFVDPESKDTLYFSKYIGEATKFMEGISGIKLKMVEENHQYSSNKTINAEIIDKWKKWYRKNKNRIIWDNHLNKPVFKK